MVVALALVYPAFPRVLYGMYVCSLDGLACVDKTVRTPLVRHSDGPSVRSCDYTLPVRLGTERLSDEGFGTMWGLRRRILMGLAKAPSESEGGATFSYTIENALAFARKTIPNFEPYIAGQRVLDYGCGPGWQAVAMATQLDAASVVAMDINPEWLRKGEALAAKYNCSDRVTFVRGGSGEFKTECDTVVSLSAFEHFVDPSSALDHMAGFVKPGGHILVAFAEPWFSHSGSHFGGYTRIPGTSLPVPWLNLIFSDEDLLALRARFRPDRPHRLEDVEGGLNRMTVKRFVSILDASGLQVVSRNSFATKGLPLVHRVPLLREFLTASVSAVLQRPPSFQP